MQRQEGFEGLELFTGDSIDRKNHSTDRRDEDKRRNESVENSHDGESPTGGCRRLTVSGRRSRFHFDTSGRGFGPTREVDFQHAVFAVGGYVLRINSDYRLENRQELIDWGHFPPP